jgi:nucleoside-diphosphate-sugar epimerase
MNKKICAITGTNGYLGGCLKDYFSAQGWEVVEVSRRPQAGARAIRHQFGQRLAPQAFTGVDVLIHCAYDFTPVRWEQIRSVNVEGTRELFRSARADGVGKIICISTISAFPGCKSLYGKAKLEIETIALDHRALIIRPGLIYGDKPAGMFGKLVGQVRGLPMVPLIGGGAQIQYLLHQADLAKFLEQHARQPSEIFPHILTAAHEYPWRFKELLQAIGTRLNKTPKFVPVPWHPVWLLLKTLETCGLRLNFRSDSLLSLMHQNPFPDFSPNAELGLTCRPLDLQKINLTN